MIKFFILLTFILSCSHKKYSFPKKDVCFLLFNLKTSTFEEIVGQKRCEERLPPASTFKIPLAVMAFDSGVLKDRDSSLKWDGVKRFMETWNRDHTAASWIKESVVWFSQELTPKIGKSAIESYLQSFEYGNADMSQGLRESWLTEHNSLKISGFEQIHFLKNLWRGELKVKTEAQLKTIDLLVVETSPSGNKLLGKTGSGRNGLRLGWWVGYLETKQDQYIVVTNFSDTEKTEQSSYGGHEAREIAKQILSDKKLW